MTDASGPDEGATFLRTWAPLIAVCLFMSFFLRTRVPQKRR